MNAEKRNNKVSGKDKRTAKYMNFLENIANIFEITIACILLIIIAINIFVMVFGFMEIHFTAFITDFKEIMSNAFILVIGIELTKMLIKHTPESVIDVLLFTIARQMVMYHDGLIDMLIGVAAIAGLFAAKKFILGIKNMDKT